CPRRTSIADRDVSATRGRGAPAVVRRSHQELPLQTAVSQSTSLLGYRRDPDRGVDNLLYGIGRRTHSRGGHCGRVDLLSRLDVSKFGYWRVHERDQRDERTSLIM